jgi:hypothetical protein
MDKFGEFLSSYIAKLVDNTLQSGEIPEAPTYIETDNIGEVVEKLVILHIRMWMLEDLSKEAFSDADMADLKRKVDICFKQKRPKLVEALNIMLDNAVETGRSLREDSVKIYKG